MIALAYSNETLTVADDDEGVHAGHFAFTLHRDDALRDEWETIQ